MVNAFQHLVNSGNSDRPFWRYRVPNGYTASVIVDPHLEQWPFRFEVRTDALAQNHDVVPCLRTEEVESLLCAIAVLPASQPGEEKPVSIEAGVFGHAPIRTYADGSTNYGPYT